MVFSQDTLDQLRGGGQGPAKKGVGENSPGPAKSVTWGRDNSRVDAGTFRSQGSGPLAPGQGAGVRVLAGHL